MTRWLGFGFVISVGLLASCGGDDDGGPVECAPGVGPAATAPCTCPDGVTMGTKSCGADGVFGSCSCGGGAGTGGTGGAGGTPPIITAGTGGVGGAGIGGVGGAGTGGAGGMSGSGGTGGTGGAVDEDAGADNDGGSAEGDQNSPCPNGNECSSELVCYLDNHCSAACDADSDCDGLSGADYTCYTMDGVCRVICADDNDCPAGLECQNVAMGGGGTTLRCMLP